MIYKYVETKQQTSEQPLGQKRNKKQFETNKNENTTHWILQEAAKVVFRGKFIAINVYIKKLEGSQINNLTLYLKELEKEELIKPKVRRRKEIMKLRMEINEVEMRKAIEKKNQ